MLSIRLTRTGKTHSPHYRIVVQEKRSKLNGKSVDIIGHYHPASADKLVVIDHEKAALWISRGAQASDTVTNLLVKAGLLDPSKKVTHFYTAAPKAEVTAEEAPAAPVAEEAAEEVAAPEEVVAEKAPETPAEEPAAAEPAADEAPAEAPAA